MSESSAFKQLSLPEAPSINRMKRSLYGVCPRPKFGPKASLHQPTQSSLPMQYPTDPMLRWESAAENVMVIKKIHDPSLDEPFVKLVSWLVKERGFKVFVERKIKKEKEVMMDERMKRVQHQLVYFDGDKSRSTLDRFVDLVICAGGDGTLIYASSLFQGAVPPTIAFHFGSLGFLLPFDFSHFQQHIDNTLQGREVSLVLRSRLIAVLSTCSLDNCMDWSLHRMEKDDHYLVLNEVVVDRGDAAYIVQLDLFVDDMLVTVVQGDGLIISTPTGSTAYSAAAGASMVHPNVPAIIITPICPHSLSFRPIVLPSGVQIKIMISPDARNGAWVSFDGRRRQNLRQGQMLVINTAAHPLPCVTYVDPVADWFNRLAGCLHWNVRKLQSSLQSSLHKSQSSNKRNNSHTASRNKKKEKSKAGLGGQANCCAEGSVVENKHHNNDNKNFVEKDDKVAVGMKISQCNLHRFNRNYNRRKKISYKIYNNTHHHHHHHHYRHPHHRRHLHPLRLRSSSLTDIQLSFLDIQKRLSLENNGGDDDGCDDDGNRHVDGGLDENGCDDDEDDVCGGDIVGGVNATYAT